MSKELFINDVVAVDDRYRIIRDEGRYVEYRQYLEHLWEIYCPYADRDFPQQLAYDFDSRFWEMYLTCTLIDNACKVTPKRTKSEGPDILIIDSSRRIFIEAVTPSPGANDNIDRVPEMKLNTYKAKPMPETEILLRYSGAIADKYKKYANYLENGIVSTDDSYVIALNSCKIGVLAKAESIGFPRIIKAVLAIGSKAVSISECSGKVVPWHYQYRPTIRRSSGSPVQTDLFLVDKYSGLSGVLYADSDIFNPPNQAGNEFIFIHNPKSKLGAIPHHYFKFGKEYYVELGQQSFSITWKDWTK